MKSVSITRLACGVAILGLLASPVVAAPLQVAVDQSPSGLDPHIVTAFSSFQIIDGTIYEGLTALNEKLEVVPGLASSWEIAEDGKAYTFKLREGVAFHNGDALTSKDVAASLNRVIAKETSSPLASRLSAVSSVETPDDLTVTVTLSEPSAPLLASLTSIAIVPAKYEKDTESLQKAPDGTGPFKFAEWQPNVAIRLEANENYWQDGLPKLVDGINFAIVPEATTRQTGLTSGQYAMLPNIDGVAALQLKGNPAVKLESTLELAYSLIGFNVTKAPFDNPKVREAINYAIKRDDIVAAALYGAGQAGGPLSPALETYATPISEFACFQPDVEKAKALMQEAGVTERVQAKLLVLPRDTTKDIAAVVQQQLAEIGIDLELETPEIGQFVQRWRNSEFDLFVSLNSGTVEPDDYFYRTFRTDGSTNVFKYSNEKLDTLLDSGRVETDPAKRKEIYAQAQQELACQGPAAFLAYGEISTAMQSNISGYVISPTRSMGSLANTTLGQ